MKEKPTFEVLKEMLDRGDVEADRSERWQRFEKQQREWEEVLKRSESLKSGATSTFIGLEADLVEVKPDREEISKGIGVAVRAETESASAILKKHRDIDLEELLDKLGEPKPLDWDLRGPKVAKEEGPSFMDLLRDL